MHLDSLSREFASEHQRGEREREREKFLLTIKK
jgi:hypothetical protein